MPRRRRSASDSVSGSTRRGLAGVARVGDAVEAAAEGAERDERVGRRADGFSSKFVDSIGAPRVGERQANRGSLL